MINVSKTAQEQVKEYFRDKAVKPVRIFVSSGCGGAQLAMALDEKKEDDSIFTYDGVEYVMETSLLEQASPVAVDFTGSGFRLDSSLELGGGCSSCGSEGSCCE